MDLIEYAQSALNLFPVQRFALKVLAGIPLSNKETILVMDPFVDRVLYKFSEAEYLKYLYNEGRASRGKTEGQPFTTLLALGRQAGKTSLQGIVAGHTVHKLMSMRNLQARYGLPSYAPVCVTIVAHNKDAMNTLMGNVDRLVKRDEMCNRLISNATQYQIRLVAGEQKVRFNVKSAYSKAFRGLHNFHTGFDEAAEVKSGYGRLVYDEVMPGMAAFHRPKKEGSRAETLESSMLLTSTPSGKHGFFYDQYRALSHPENTRGITLQIPTWEMNPSISRDWFREEFKRDERYFRKTYGAEFLDA